MSNQWLRLWHDMPTDPKWRTISKASGQRIGDVMAVYVHLLVCASNATERGRTQSFNSEDVASALDLDTEQVEQIVAAMQNRVLDGDLLKGWESRQVAREDGSAERAKAWRESKKTTSERTQNAPERKRTPDTDTDTDKDKEKKEEGEKPRERATPPARPDDVAEQVWSDWLQLRKTKKAPVTETVLSDARTEAGKAGLSLERFLTIWCGRGSQGMSADWIKPNERSPGPAQRPFQNKFSAAAAGVFGAPQQHSEVIDV